MTDRIEAIRARNKAIDRPARVADDVAYLLDLVGRQHAQFLELNKVIDDQQERIDDLNDEIANCRVLEYEAKVRRVEAEIATWNAPNASGYIARIRAALAPVAPDAEPVEWEWSPGDVVLDADGIAWQRDGERIHYPWMAVGQAVQRDQDITDLVTNRGGRVLVCKARGIGVGGAS